MITHMGTTYTIKLPQLAKSADLENVFTALASALECCHNMFCNKLFFRHESSYNFFFLALDSVKKDCSNCDLKPTPAKRKPPPEQEAATSTTPGDTSHLSESPLASRNKIPTNEWGIEEVIQFIESKDASLGAYADLFRTHVCSKWGWRRFVTLSVSGD